MSKDIIYYAENVCGLNLTDNQKEILLAVQNSKDRGQKVFLSFGRTQGIATLRNTFYGYEVWLKDQKTADLEYKLSLTGQALELCYSKLVDIICKTTIIQDIKDIPTKEHFINLAKEMMKSE